MEKIFCTLFDRQYMARGVTMVRSLLETSNPKEVTILAMSQEYTRDYECYLTLMELFRYDHRVRVIPLDRVIDFHPELSKVFQSRTYQEFCWTMASWFCWFLLKIQQRPCVTYLDADMMFFSDCQAVFDEIGDRSIAIVPHRFIPEKAYLAVNGIFNVSWVSFRYDTDGLICCQVWKDQCLDWCYNRVEEHRMGDQKYLDQWPEQYHPKVLCVLKNIGVGTAPWNLGNYTVAQGPRVNGIPVILYHFHEFMEKEDGTYRLTNYELREADIEHVYKPFLLKYEQVKEELRRVSC